MSAAVEIRPASIGDCDAVAALTGELGYSATTEEMRVRLESVLRVQAQTVLVAEAAGQVVGWIHVALVPSLETEPYAEIRGLIVASAWRSGGIGGRLVQAAERWAAQEGVSRIRVRSNVVRDRARHFYERRGYRITKTQNVFDRDLTP